MISPAAAAAAIQHDRKAAADLAALLGPSDLVERMPTEFGLPVYIARLDGPKVRYVALLPQTIKRTRSIQERVGSLVSGLMGGLSLPADVRVRRAMSRCSDVR